MHSNGEGEAESWEGDEAGIGSREAEDCTCDEYGSQSGEMEGQSEEGERGLEEGGEGDEGEGEEEEEEEGYSYSEEDEEVEGENEGSMEGSASEVRKAACVVSKVVLCL